ncbi:Predicted thiamin transporter PnuT [hydrothermal vent metagenome]|uniref:Predicted thiamin transporter PnuT n=1 Tax=hydrothermal vent metagenome TaxID=652676 RepID=A0A3B0VSY2_9ZZZZ
MLVENDLNIVNTIITSLLAQSGWEWLAASLGITYVVLASKASIWCWPVAFISTLIYTLLFWEGQLPMQALLNLYYMGMAIYGFMLWRKHNQSNQTLAITQRPITFHLKFIAAGLLLTALIGTYLSSLANAQLPYLDAIITVFSVMNTVLMARKILESWLYWMVINTLAMTLFFQTGYYATLMMFSVYLILAFYGYYHWKNIKTAQDTPSND